MLNFQPTDEQQMLVDAIDRFAKERIREEFRDGEENGRLPQPLVHSGWEMGWLQTAIPEPYGGFGEYSAVTGALALEAFAFGDLATTLQIMTPNNVAIPLMLAGSDDQKAKYLPQCVGEKPPPFTTALTEHVYQFDPRNLETTAVSQKDGYVLNGRKVYVPLADEAELFLVWANEAGQTQGFLVPAATAGVTVGKRDKLMGLNGLPTFELLLDNVTVPASARLGEDAGADFNLILNHSRVGVGATAVGVANAALQYAITYAKQREQFGRPIAQNQSIAFLLADMASDVESMRLMVWEAATLLDAGEDATRAALLMKHFVDQAAVRVTDGAVLILGGYGYIREYPVELWLRNARGFATFDGLVTV